MALYPDISTESLFFPGGEMSGGIYSVHRPWVDRGADVSVSIIITELEAMVGSLGLESYSNITDC